MQKLQYKKGSIILYLVLIVITLTVMIVARNKSLSHLSQASDNDSIVNIGLHISPNILTTVNGENSGIYYNFLKQTAADNGIKYNIKAYSDINAAMSALRDERIDNFVIEQTLMPDSLNSISHKNDTVSDIIFTVF